MLRSLFDGALLGVRAWRHGLVHPFYVPAELRHIQALLSEGKVADATLDLWRLASLGSNPAAATLGYMCLACGELSGVDCAVAIRLCADSANRGDSYAQYVIAWHEYEQGNNRKLAKWLHRSARQQFPPAIGDLGLLFIAPPKASKRRPYLAKRFFRLAINRGHLTSISFFLRGCKQGVFGGAYRTIGYLFFPLAVLLITPVIWLYPFSLSVFAYPASNKKPLFSRR
jgi:hypothetical protein